MLQKYFRKHERWPLVLQIARRVKKSGGRVLIVGGAVRDAWLKRRGRAVEVKDIDLEVYGLDKETLKQILEYVISICRSKKRSRNFCPISVIPAKAGIQYGKNFDRDPSEIRTDSRFHGNDENETGRLVLKEIGQQFGVFNLSGLDIALPRVDSRTRPGMGRKPQVVSQPHLDFEPASRRRDLTINALAFDPLTGEILDAHGGLKDLDHSLLRAVDLKTFGDDPLRVLRVMQFAGRFGFKIHPKTIKLCRDISLKHLAKERVGEEWRKMMLKSSRPSLGLEAGRQLGILQKLHPNLARLSRADWNATKRAVDFIAHRDTCNAQRQTSVRRIACHDSRYTIVWFAALTHRLSAGARYKFLQHVNLPKKQAASVLALVRLSALPKHLTDEAVRRLAYELSKASLNVKDLVWLLEAIGGEAGEIMNRAEVLHVADKAPQPVLRGSDLLRLGVKPGKGMGELLKKVFKEQLRGRFDDRHHQPQKKIALVWIESKK